MQNGLVPMSHGTVRQVELTVRALASEEGWPLTDIRALEADLGALFSILRLTLNHKPSPSPCPRQHYQLRQDPEMELKPWVLEPGLSLMLCDSQSCAFCK